jgi:excisionase family DNA binding protein
MRDTLNKPEIFEAMLDLRQTMKILGVSRPTLLKLIYQKKVPAMKVGRSWRFQPRALREFLDRNSDFFPKSRH